MYDDYMWILVVGCFSAFAMAWGIGANDVANSFATSVGAKTITLTQACLIAAVFEFAGAMTLGRVVTGTISGGIARTSTFSAEPEVYAYGMLCALVCATTWLYVATYYELAVSTTHSIIGGVVGFSLAYKGEEAIIWNDEADVFPFRKGITVIVLSWFTSPIFAAIASSIIFFLCRTLVLRRQNSFEKTFWIMPFAILLTVFINVFFVLSKGAGKMILASGDKSWCADAKCSLVDVNKAGWVAVACAAGVAVVGSAILIPVLKRRALAQFDKENKQVVTVDKITDDAEAGIVDEPTTKFGRFLAKAKKAAMHGVNQDIHSAIKDDQDAMDIQEGAEQFDPKAEIAFQYLQVFSAICVSFAHGANDVANAVGPLAGIFMVVDEMKFNDKFEPPVWILIIGACGLVVGLATYGYKIMAALGVRMAAMTPSRGYSAELSTSLVISIASAYGMPISTTHTITGAVVGVGMMEGKGGVNWKHFAKTFSAWVFTLFFVGILSAAMFSQGAYAPSIQGNRAILFYETNITAGTNYLIKGANMSLLNGTDIANAKFAKYKAALTKLASSVKNEVDTKKTGVASEKTIMANFYSALTLYQKNSIFTLGQPTAALPTGTVCKNPANKTSIACTDSTIMPQLVDSKYRTSAWN